jgi:hypothetical protein
MKLFAIGERKKGIRGLDHELAGRLFLRKFAEINLGKN